MKRLPKLLVLDDDKSWLSQVPLVLEGVCDVHGYSSIDQGLEAISNTFFDIILLDINFDGDTRSGLDVLRIIQAADRGADVIIISGETNRERVIQIANAGALKYLVKPVPPDTVEETVTHALQLREAKLRVHKLKSSGTGIPLIGNSLAMQKLRQDISDVVAMGVKDILLLGETGTGKEVVAQAIAFEADPARRIIPIHCGAISDGLAESELFGHMRGAFTGADKDRMSAFEAASGGFVFLDEIGDMPLSQQAKLLRVIQERKVQRVGSHKEIIVNFRTISATNINIEEAISQKRFREDLYYRLGKVSIKIPALRDHLEDLPELVHHFLMDVCPKKTPIIANDALDLLQAYSWPGNVRQLRAVIESVAMRTKEPIIREKEICQALPQLATLFGTKASKLLVGRYGAGLILKERDKFERALTEALGDRDKAAMNMGLSRSTFYRRAKELGLIKERKRRDAELGAVTS